MLLNIIDLFSSQCNCMFNATQCQFNAIQCNSTQCKFNSRNFDGWENPKPIHSMMGYSFNDELFIGCWMSKIF